MNKFTLYLRRNDGKYWEAEFDCDFFIIGAWYNGQKTKLTERRELALFKAFNREYDLEHEARAQKVKTE